MGARLAWTGMRPLFLDLRCVGEVLLGYMSMSVIMIVIQYWKHMICPSSALYDVDGIERAGKDWVRWKEGVCMRLGFLDEAVRESACNDYTRDGEGCFVFHGTLLFSSIFGRGMDVLVLVLGFNWQFGLVLPYLDLLRACCQRVRLLSQGGEEDDI